MAASEYLSTKTEGQGRHPIKAALYTGIACATTHSSSWELSLTKTIQSRKLRAASNVGIGLAERRQSGRSLSSAVGGFFWSLPFSAPDFSQWPSRKSAGDGSPDRKVPDQEPSIAEQERIFLLLQGVTFLR